MKEIQGTSPYKPRVDELVPSRQLSILLASLNNKIDRGRRDDGREYFYFLDVRVAPTPDQRAMLAERKAVIDRMMRDRVGISEVAEWVTNMLQAFPNFSRTEDETKQLVRVYCMAVMALPAWATRAELQRIAGLDGTGERLQFLPPVPDLVARIDARIIRLHEEAALIGKVLLAEVRQKSDKTADERARFVAEVLKNSVFKDSVHARGPDDPPVRKRPASEDMSPEAQAHRAIIARANERILARDLRAAGMPEDSNISPYLAKLLKDDPPPPVKP